MHGGTATTTAGRRSGEVRLFQLRRPLLGFLLRCRATFLCVIGRQRGTTSSSLLVGTVVHTCNKHAQPAAATMVDTMISIILSH